jgi:hypothetical protein
MPADTGRAREAITVDTGRRGADVSINAERLRSVQEPASAECGKSDQDQPDNRTIHAGSIY